MKIMIASDIHGSAYYLEQLLNRYDEENPDNSFFLETFFTMVRAMICQRVTPQRTSSFC